MAASPRYAPPFGYRSRGRAHSAASVFVPPPQQQEQEQQPPAAATPRRGVFLPSQQAAAVPTPTVSTYAYTLARSVEVQCQCVQLMQELAEAERAERLLPHDLTADQGAGSALLRARLVEQQRYLITLLLALSS